MSVFSSGVTRTVQDLEIHFDYDDNREKQYFLPGELMKGTVLLHLQTPIKVKKITMHLKGMAKVSWEIPERKKTYSSNECYLDLSKPLLDGLYDSLNLGKGTHEFNFNHLLSPALPSTFQGVYGSVTYIMKVELEGANQQHNTVTSEPFLVLRRPPLPRDTYLPRDLKDGRRFLTLCNYGKVSLKAGLTRYGGVPGEYVYINAQVTNWSDRQIQKIMSSIVMTSEFFAKGKKISFRQVISRREDEYNFHNAHGRRWRQVKLSIPPYIPDTDLPGCEIMNVFYTFHFKVELDDCDLKIETPVQVGGHPEGYNPIADSASLAKLSTSRDMLFPNGNSIDNGDLNDFY